MKYCPRLDCPHRTLTGVAAEYEDATSTCGDCGSELSDRPPAEPRPTTDLERQGEPVEIHFYPETANLAASRLEGEGIPAFVDDRSTSWDRVLSLARPEVRVVVARRDVERARAILARERERDLEEVASQFPPARAEDVCPSCGSEDVVTVRVTGPGALVFLIERLAGRTEWCRTCGHEWDRAR